MKCVALQAELVEAILDVLLAELLQLYLYALCAYRPSAALAASGPVHGFWFAWACDVRGFKPNSADSAQAQAAQERKQTAISRSQSRSFLSPLPSNVCLQRKSEAEGGHVLT